MAVDISIHHLPNGKGASKENACQKGCVKYKNEKSNRERHPTYILKSCKLWDFLKEISQAFKEILGYIGKGEILIASSKDKG